jgi:DAK2 domain fusion protein YloV
MAGKNQVSRVLTIGGALYRDMVFSAANTLANNQKKINDMNVFPVPDGDTGLNMSMTLSTARPSTDGGESIGAAAGEIASSALRSARGNSGVILSLFFRGAAKALRELSEAGAADLASAFRQGANEAYRAVSNPTEGTILTVMRCSAEAAEKLVHQKPDVSVDALFDKMYTVSRETLKKTPEMLPALKQAGVVDAGGMGFVAVLQGMIMALRGKPVPKKKKADDVQSEVFEQFNTEDITFPYCTECIVTKSEEFRGENTASAFRDFVLAAGDSAVFVDDEEIIKVHVHTSDPGKVLSEALKYGSLFTVKIENMREQHTNLTGSGKSASEEKKPKDAKPEKEYGFVSVCTGDGIAAVFRDLGADEIVVGGQTMNPSTNDVLAAIRKTPSHVVFVLPNNKNICMVAAQAALLEKKKQVVVIPTHSIQEGVSVMMAFDPDAELAANEAAMNGARESVVSLSVTYAVRDSIVNGETVKGGEILGLVRGKICCHDTSRDECIRMLCKKIPEATYLTVFRGADVSEEEAEATMAIIRDELGASVEAILVDGGQPLYDFLISAE